jgi:hypothetical protein
MSSRTEFVNEFLIEDLHFYASETNLPNRLESEIISSKLV